MILSPISVLLLFNNNSNSNQLVLRHPQMPYYRCMVLPKVVRPLLITWDLEVMAIHLTWVVCQWLPDTLLHR